MNSEQREIAVADEDRGKRIDALLHERMPEFSRSRLQTWIKSGQVLLGGVAVKPSHTLRGGENIAVHTMPLPALHATAEDIPLRILYEDAACVAIDKPAGMVVHAGAGIHKGTLVNALLHRFERLSEIGGELRPGIVHRSGSLHQRRDRWWPKTMRRTAIWRPSSRGAR